MLHSWRFVVCILQSTFIWFAWNFICTLVLRRLQHLTVLVILDFKWLPWEEGYTPSNLDYVYFTMFLCFQWIFCVYILSMLLSVDIEEGATSPPCLSGSPPSSSGLLEKAREGHTPPSSPNVSITSPFAGYVSQYNILRNVMISLISIWLFYTIAIMNLWGNM